MYFDYWEYVTWFAKLGLYLGTAIVIGGFFSYLSLGLLPEIKQKLLKYMTFGAALGLCSSIFSFLFLVGSFSNTGFWGIFDFFYFNFLIQTSIGQIHLIRFFCFFALLGLLLTKLYQPQKRLNLMWQLIYTMLLIFLCISFALLGHVANLNIFAQVLITLHILTISIWMGSLYPLWLTSQQIKGQALKQSIVRFGQVAVFIVIILLTCGIGVALILIQDWKELINTAYGQGFVLKILLVGSLLLLAACNKLYLTPRLPQDFYVKKLRLSILLEMIVGCLIFIITAYITTVTGIG